MVFKLPKYTELTNDQKIIAGLGFYKNILVSAAPGTGKTVIAIYRAHELSEMLPKHMVQNPQRCRIDREPARKNCKPSYVLD